MFIFEKKVIVCVFPLNRQHNNQKAFFSTTTVVEHTLSFFSALSKLAFKYRKGSAERTRPRDAVGRFGNWAGKIHPC